MRVQFEGWVYSLVDIDDTADHGLVVLGLEDVVEANRAAENVPYSRDQ